ncbi:hypothetical protein SASPL_121624 [Salvia splendens]|uniref:Myb-like domain-containing protein n=1 Tax=Salvia splendens TaxID=180675 RepID=A0A8X8XWU6_SALSN|nr:golgin subfamily A member 6-like protein 6 [Salvia splendens]KAG6419403.1 hypothetical protein SASPL_121624 [Salvia splendens]
MDWSENNLCIKCNKGGNVLLCNGKGCPLAVHEGCLGCPARVDDAERFFCPYCGYKQAVAESRKARECVLARKKALLIFMGGSVIDMGEDKTFADNRLNQSKIVDADDGKSKSKNDGIIDRPYLLGKDGKIGTTEEDSESSAGSEGDPSLMMNGENGNGTVEGKQIQEEEREASEEKKNIQEEEREASVEKKNIQEVEHEASVEKETIQEEEREASVEKENIQEEEREASVEKENIQEEEREASVEKENVQEEECEASVEENIQEEEREASVEEESIQEEDCGTSSASTDRDLSLNRGPRAKRGSKRRKPIDKEPKTVSAQSKFRKQPDKKKQASTTLTLTKRSTRISSSAMGTGKVVREEFASPSSLRKHEKPSEKSDTFSSGKRRKVVWMEEEEEALREGAKKHMDEAKIPWKKILEESSKFDPTRTPNDLKNRWRIVKFA